MAFWKKNSDLLVTYIENYRSTPIIWINEQGIITECNAALNEILGQKEKPIGQSIKDFLVVDTLHQFILPTINENYIKTCWHFRSPSNVCSFDCHILRKDSQIIVFTERPLITGDAIISQMGALNLEITNMTRDLLKKKAKMEKTNQSLQADITKTVARAERLAALASFAASIAHEITQPLNSIKLAADSALYWQKRGESLSLSDVLKDMESISIQAGQIDGIIRHIHALANKQPIEMVACDVNHAVQKVLLTAQELAEDKDIMVIPLLSPQPLIVQGNSIGLSEVITNLINNSIIALQSNQISEKKIFVKTYQEKDKIILEVADNGPGIPEEVRGDIFEPFFSASGKSGMGLGLSIVKAIVTAHSGKIEVKCEAGQGTTFVIELPFH